MSKRQHWLHASQRICQRPTSAFAGFAARAIENFSSWFDQPGRNSESHERFLQNNG
jgi:hypothetical protein